MSLVLSQCVNLHTNLRPTDPSESADQITPTPKGTDGTADQAHTDSTIE